MKIGIDIGGSHVGIGLVDEFGNIQQKKEKYIVEKIENESQISKKNLKEEITQFIIQTIKEYQKMDFVENVGIAVPGTVNQTTIIKAVNLGIENYEITPIIEKETGTKVKLKNEENKKSNLFVTFWGDCYGNFSECENGLFLCVGTGVGGAVIYNGKVLETKEVPGFEFSHMIIQKNGLQCNCGKRGCFEIYASLKRFKEKIAYEFNLTTLRNEEIIKIILNNKDDVRLKYFLNEYIENLAIGISNLINIFEPEKILIGGGFADYKEILLEPLKQQLLTGNLLFNKRNDIIIQLAKFKNDAGIIGATLI